MEENDLIQAASNTLQSHENLCYLMKQKLKDVPQAKQALEEGISLLDQLRLLKSRLEGSHYKFQPPSLSSDLLSELRLLSTAFTPATLNDTTKAKISDKLHQLFGDQVKRVVHACLLTCPWFAAVQSEVSAQARNNILYVIYTATDEQFFSLASPHERELGETLDEGVVFAAEVRHFCWQLFRGNVRALEVLSSPPDSIILSSPDWSKLLQILNDPSQMLTKSFLDRALGQAVGAIIKKKTVNGQLVLRDDISLTKFCDSFRLLSYVQCCQQQKTLCPWTTSQAELCSRLTCGEEAIKLLHSGFKGEVHWERLLGLVVASKSELESVEPAVRGSSSESQKEVGEWLAAVRMDGIGLTEVEKPHPSDHQQLAQLIKSIGVGGIDPAQILIVAEAGSHLYNLSLPTSDTGYIVIYYHPTKTLMSSISQLKDNRGQKLDEETGAYEARMFCEMLMKGAVNMVELVFAGLEGLLYVSEAWKRLAQHKQLFLSEKVLLQYSGYIKTHMKIIKSKKHSGTPRERKIFYNIFHKLLSLEQFVEGKPPIVKCTGENRDYIMRIRHGPLEGELSADSLYTRASERLSEAEAQLRARPQRLWEFGDYTFLQRWLLTVRGVDMQHAALRMAQPALVKPHLLLKPVL